MATSSRPTEVSRSWSAMPPRSGLLHDILTLVSSESSQGNAEKYAGGATVHRGHPQ